MEGESAVLIRRKEVSQIHLPSDVEGGVLLGGHQVDEVAVAINDAKPLARCFRSRLGSPVGIALVVLLTPSLPGPELVLVLQNELHLSECWRGKGQKQ